LNLLPFQVNFIEQAEEVVLVKADGADKGLVRELDLANQL
jgi:hypothetical protein